MDIKKLATDVIMKNMSPEQQRAVLESVNASVKEAKAVQRAKVGEHVELVLEALKKIEAKMLVRIDETASKADKKVASLKDGKDGLNGRDGRDGKDGKAGKDGLQGPKGFEGKAGRDGVDGKDGVSVTDAHIDFDGSLIITLSTGKELNVGEVLPMGVAEKIKVIGNGGGTSQSVIDALAALQTQINAIASLPSQTGQAGKFLTTDGTNPAWGSVPYPVTSVAGKTGAVTLVNADVSGSAASGANSDITSMSGLTGGITTPDYITFDVNPSTIPTAPGSLYWDNADGNQTLSLVMAGNQATQQIGEEQYFRIKASAAIADGDCVMFTGTVGASGALTGAPASGLTASTASYVMGISTQPLANNAWGYITSFGLVRGINTTGASVGESWAAGDILYYNPSVAGGLTKTVPTAPAAKVQVCAVIYAHASNGSVFVRPAFGGTLGQYEGDVKLTSVANGDLLVRNTGTGVWENKAQSTLALTSGQITTGLGFTPYNATNPSNYATQAYVDQYIQGIDAKGACRVASTGNVVAITGLLTIDGQTLIAGDRVLLKDQATASQNGIYVVSAIAWSRAADLDTWPEAPGAFTFIEQGTVNAGSGWVTTVTPGGTIGVTSMPWTQFSGVGTYTAGTGLSLTGSQFSIDSTVATLTGSQTLTNKTLTSPTLTTPALGTPASGNLANCTFPTLNQNTTGSAGSLASTNFSIVESGGKLLFKYGATTIASMSSTGVITSAVNIVSNGTP